MLAADVFTYSLEFRCVGTPDRTTIYLREVHSVRIVSGTTSAPYTGSTHREAETFTHCVHTLVSI